MSRESAAADAVVGVEAGAARPEALAGTFLIDAHVHCHDGVAPPVLLDHASRNIATAAAGSGVDPAAGWLLFSEMPRDHVFAALRSGTPDLAGWTLEQTAEANSLLAHGSATFPLVLVAGRQVLTREGLEVLALFTPGPFPDGLDLAATVAAVRAAGGLAVLPWGFGKWWGARGRVLARFLEEAAPGTVFLGDNGGRPQIGATPRPFRLAAARGIPILPGSDPLPLAAEQDAVGRYGFVLDGSVDPARPAAGILRLLQELQEQPRAFGQRQRLVPFLARQIALRRRNPDDFGPAPDVASAGLEVPDAAAGRPRAQDPVRQPGFAATAVAPHTAEPPDLGMVAAAPRVLVIAPQPFFRATGTPINVRTMCRALTEGGFEVHLLTLPHGEDVTLPGLTLHRALRLPGVCDVPVGFSVTKLLYNLLLAVALGRLLRRRAFALVHAVEEASFYAIPLAHWFGVPGLVDLDSDLAQQLRDHGSVPARILARPAAWLRRVALRRAVGALTVAPRVSNSARAESPHTPVFEIADVPTEDALRPPDPGRMAALRAELGLEGRRLIVYTGNHHRRQGLELLVEAMVEVVHRHPDACLLVVGGSAADVQALQARVARCGLAEAVRPIGARPPETMPEYMGLAEVLVSPRLEPHVTPLKVFSYMASGRPIVATDLPTHCEVLEPDMAILVPPTRDGLSTGIIRALADPAAAAVLGETARQRVQERHTFPLFKCRLLEAYATVLGRLCEDAEAFPVAERPRARPETQR